jgi:hypothetical protein
MTGMRFLEEALVVHPASRRCERVRSLFYANSFGFRIVRVAVVIVRCSGLSNAHRGSVAWAQLSKHPKHAALFVKALKGFQ